MMENLKDILKEIQGYRKLLNMPNLSDDMILDVSVRIFNRMNYPVFNEQRKQEERPPVKQPDTPITPEQIKFLKKRSMTERLKGINIEKLTKGEAYQIIKEIKEKESKEERSEDYTDY